MRVLLKGLKFNCTEASLGAQLLSHGCSMPEKIVITRPKGASFAGGAKHCCAFLWYGSEQQCGTVVSIMDGLILSCSLGPIRALLVADRDKASTSSASAAVSSQAAGSRLSTSQPVAAPVRGDMAQSSQSTGASLSSTSAEVAHAAPALEVLVLGAKCKAQGRPPMRANVARTLEEHGVGAPHKRNRI